MVDPKALEGCLRCHECRLVPNVTFEDSGDVELRCEKHGHVARGEDLEQAVKHWNIYIHFQLTGEVLG